MKAKEKMKRETSKKYCYIEVSCISIGEDSKGIQRTRIEEIVQSYLGEKSMVYYTFLHFPEEKQQNNRLEIQKQNYDYFISTMSEMFKKYAPEMKM